MTRTIALIAVATGLFAGIAGPAAAQSSERLMNGNSVYGVPFAGAKADVVVDLNARQSLDIVCGQTVQFRQGDKSFTWKFDVVGHRSVDLAKIAPAGFVTKPFTVHVEKNDGERA
ncbi:CzcE family metal-binding protein [Mitsuaria sp. GD03876]|uniref:CzcE family metal-binding protein n=1 Tax=Mitsuaria sp. GD03876 TaxID=2975399 RepID=UPI0024468AF2|nr:CzcE family metal-binding protein [Mitsuaria sp. GD03876]MDH0863845.1 CzcE family metal-binding protein [Mitsuaria sp. GD03876]